MTPYFADQDKVDRLSAAARLWAGTPFAAHSQARGVGADCVHLIRGILDEAGFHCPPLAATYPLDWADHQERSLLLAYLEESASFECAGSAEPGDVLCIQLGRCCHHAGLMLPRGRFLHCLRRIGTVEQMFADATWHKRIVAIYRPMI